MKQFLGFIIIILSALSVLFAVVCQIVLIYQRFGFFVGGKVTIFIPHWSAWFFLGVITAALVLLLSSDKREKK